MHGARRSVVAPRYRGDMSSAQLVAEARKRAALSRSALAERLGVSVSTVSRWERRKTQPSFESLVRVMKVCDLDIHINIVPRDHESRRLLAAQANLSPDEIVDELVEWASNSTCADRSRTFFTALPCGSE